jgi:hypothetical protein
MGLSCDDLILDKMLRGDTLLGDSGVRALPVEDAEVINAVAEVGGQA